MCVGRRSERTLTAYMEEEELEVREDSEKGRCVATTEQEEGGGRREEEGGGRREEGGGRREEGGGGRREEGGGRREEEGGVGGSREGKYSKLR